MHITFIIGGFLMKKKYLKRIKKGISLWLTICLIMTMLPIAMSEVSAEVSVSISLNDASYSDEQYRFNDLTVTGSGIKSILISFNKSVSDHDRIVLPTTTPVGFTISSTSGTNNYTKRINLDGDVPTADVQNYLRAVAYNIESDSQSVQVVVTSEDILYDTYYSIDTEHYYQYVSKDEGIAWTDAYDEAKGMSYMDRTGYLATIMS